MSEAHSHLYALGKMTVFYLPSHKLDDPRFLERAEEDAAGELHLQPTARGVVHDFLMEHFRAYTHTPTPVKGYWTDPNGALVHDVMERFEVSFEQESDFSRLIDFLVGACERLDEAAIYVTRGDRSFLVQRG